MTQHFNPNTTLLTTFLRLFFSAFSLHLFSSSISSCACFSASFKEQNTWEEIYFRFHFPGSESRWKMYLLGQFSYPRMWPQTTMSKTARVRIEAISKVQDGATQVSWNTHTYHRFNVSVGIRFSFRVSYRRTQTWQNSEKSVSGRNPQIPARERRSGDGLRPQFTTRTCSGCNKTSGFFMVRLVKLV